MLNCPCVEAITWCLGPNLTLCGHDMQRLAGPNPQALFSFAGIVLENINTNLQKSQHVVRRNFIITICCVTV